MSPREDFWQRWSPWRHGEPGQGNFADVMRVLRLYPTFAEHAARHVPRSDRAVTILDLACGSAPMAGPLAEALRARGVALDRYVGVDFADPVEMPSRVARELSRHGLSDRGEYVHHDLSGGLPAGLADRLGSGPLVITSCWGITYLAPGPLRALLLECARLAADRPGGATLHVHMLSAGQFDRDVLTRRFLGEIVPRHVLQAARGLDPAPLRAIGLAMRALPKMRQFGDEVKNVVELMPVSEMLSALRDCGMEPADVDATALWGQTTSLTVKLPGQPLSD